MKRLPALLGYCLLATMFLAPAIVEAVPMAADPITISLNNPNQVTAAPSSGVTTLNFSGTIVVDSSWRLSTASLDFAYNSSVTNFLTGNFDSAFITFTLGGNGTYTGNIFSVNVPTGTLPDLYAFALGGVNPSLFSLTAIFEKGCIGDGCFVDGGSTQFTASEAYSVLVTNGIAVPEGGSTLLLLGASVAGLCCLRRSFA